MEEENQAAVTGTLIEGISDDIVYTSVVILCGIGFFWATVLYWQQRRSQRQTIHPQSQAEVDGTRQQLAQQQQHEENEQSSERGPSAAADPTHRRATDGNCPVCISNIEYAVETNCGHVFCGICMITYWRHGNWLGAVRCPVCRQQVTILLRCFTEEEQTQSTTRKEEVNTGISQYNRRFSGEPVPWMDYIRDLPTILRHLYSEFFSVGGLIWMFRLRIVLCFCIALLYCISPLDIIPEAAFGFLGLIDDFFILLLFAIYLSVMYRRYIAAQA